jgi:hypothetical protein
MSRRAAVGQRALSEWSVVAIIESFRTLRHRSCIFRFAIRTNQREANEL